MFDTVIAGAVIVSAQDGYRPLVGSVGIEGNTLAYVGPRQLGPGDGRSYLDGQGKILLPGLVNGHCHGDMGFAKGFADNTTLGQQMKALSANNWFYDQLTDEDRFYARLHTYAEALLSGTTLLMENMYWSLGTDSQRAFAEIGLRGAPAEDVRYDFYKSDGFLTEEMLSAFVAECGKNGLIPVLGTLPEEEFNRERLQKVHDVLRNNGCFFTSHLAETPWRHQAALDAMGATPVQALDQFGLINERYIASHAVYLDETDIALMAERGAKVVNTPLCEMKIADGIAPIPEMVRAGVVVALGTDGAMWNNSNDLFREMKGMALLHSINSGVKALNARQVLDMATLNGARLFGLENRLGTVEEGKLADIILVDATAPHMGPLRTGRAENVSSSLVYCATGRDVTDVFVDGRHLVQNRALPGIDLADIQRRVLDISQKAAETLPDFEETQ